MSVRYERFSEGVGTGIFKKEFCFPGTHSLKITRYRPGHRFDPLVCVAPG